MSYKRGDSVTVYNPTDRLITTILFYEDVADDEDWDVFGDGGAYSIIHYDVDLAKDTFDEGVLSGYETPQDVIDELCGDVVKIVDDAWDCGTTAELCYRMMNDRGIDLSVEIKKIEKRTNG